MTTGDLEDLLGEWLPYQRWFAGKDQENLAPRVVSQRHLATGDPGLLHVLVATGTSAAQRTYQVLLGVRDTLPGQLEHARLGHVDGLGTVYDAVHDHELMRALIDWVAADATVEGISFRSEPGATLDPEATSRVLGAEQSNTSVVFGDQTILKLFRIIVPGTNPDLEVTRALTEASNAHVAALHGWFEADVAGTPTTLGILQQFLRSGSDGWALALTSVRDLFAEGDLHAEEVGGDFAAESERLGMATADVHETLARTLETKLADPATLAEMARQMQDRLVAATAVVPALEAHSDAISATFDAFARRRDPLRLQRVHGDYHLGQAMRTDTGWVLLDFEGEPGAPVAKRAELSTPIRDVAGMLRSFDYASRYLLADHEPDPQLGYRAVEWSDRNRDAFCLGYAKVAGQDPRDDAIALRAFELDKAVYEVVYDARNRPSWVGIPLGSIERLLAA